MVSTDDDILNQETCIEFWSLSYLVDFLVSFLLRSNIFLTDDDKHKQQKPLDSISSIFIIFFLDNLIDSVCPYLLNGTSHEKE